MIYRKPILSARSLIFPVAVLGGAAAMLLAAPAFGQRRGGPGTTPSGGGRPVQAAPAPSRTVSPTGFGRILFPGGGGPGTASGSTTGRILYPGTGAPAARRTPGSGQTGGYSPGAIVGGFPVGYGGAYGASGFSFPILPSIAHETHYTRDIQRGLRQPPSAVPYPVFYGGGYYDYDAPPAQVLGSGPVYGSGEPQPSPVVIVNQYFQADADAPASQQRNGATETGPTTAPQQNFNAALASGGAAGLVAEPVVFLIALEDSSVLTAISYWIESDTLNYITTQGTQNQVSLSLVDRDLSRRLNRERNVAFGLPGN